MEQKLLFDQPSVLTQEQVRFYIENGFVVAENVLSEKECDQAVTIFDIFRQILGDKEYKGIMNLDQIDYWSHLCKPENYALFRWIHNYVKQMLVKHPAIVTGLEILQGTEVGGVVNLQSMFLFKRAGSPFAKQAWNPHQDNAYPQAEHGAYITANLVFSDQDPENGGMYIYPGSHAESLLESEKRNSFHEKPGEENPGHDVSKSLPEEYKDKKTDLIMKKGSVLFLHGHCVHGSYPNNSSYRDRPMLLIPYLTNGHKFVPGKIGQRKELPIR